MARYSIIQDDLKECLVCKTTRNIHIHHIYQGVANRKNSEKYHCIVALCARHHNMSSAGIHYNKELDKKIKQLAQTTFEKNHTREEFREIFGKSFL